MDSLQLRTAFRRLFAQWYLLGLAARCLQFTLIFEAVSHGVGAAWMGAVMAASSVACAVFTIYAGRLYNRFGPSPLNRCAALCCAGAGFLATQHEVPAALAVAWMLTGMTLMLAATAGYRGIGGLFDAADRVSRFSRMCLLSNVSEIAMPVAIGALFSQAPDLMPFIVLAVSLALSFLSSGVSRSDLRAHGLVESTDLLVNIRRLAGSGPLLAGVVAGSGVNALFCILDILVPTAGGGMGLTTTQTGTLLSACALAQVAASSILSVRANHRTLLPQLRNLLARALRPAHGAGVQDPLGPREAPRCRHPLCGAAPPGLGRRRGRRRAPQGGGCAHPQEALRQRDQSHDHLLLHERRLPDGRPHELRRGLRPLKKRTCTRRGSRMIFP